MKKYNQVEGILFSHYEKLSELNLHKRDLIRTEKRIENLEKIQDGLQYNIEDDLQGVQMQEDKVTTSRDNTSSIEKALLKEEQRIRNLLIEEKKNKTNLQYKISKLQQIIDGIDIVIESFKNDDIELIESRYRNKMSYRKIAYDIPCDEKTVRRNKDRVIKEMAKRLSEEY